MASEKLKIRGDVLGKIRTKSSELHDPKTLVSKYQVRLFKRFRSMQVNPLGLQNLMNYLSKKILNWALVFHLNKIRITTIKLY